MQNSINDGPLPPTNQELGTHARTAPTTTIPHDPVDTLRLLLGEDVVLLAIKRGEKAPMSKAWQKKTLKDMADPKYLASLRTGNIGVSLGGPSNGLCSIDVDDDAGIEEFLALNPALKKTLQTRGSRGGNIWVRIIGPYPKLTPLTYDAVTDASGSAKKWGEWRATGGQTVIHGKHPLGSDYRIVWEAKPIEISFDSIVWPDYLSLPWGNALYEELVQKQGEPYAQSKKGAIKLNDYFFIQKFIEEHTILYESSEGSFYEYDPQRGLWLTKTTHSVKDQFAQDLKSYANLQGEAQIERMRKDNLLNGWANLLKGRAEQKGVFSQRKRVIHVANGMLHLDTNPPKLWDFSPNYYSRNQCPIQFVEDAECPRFKKELLETALDPEDIWLLQRWIGSLLLGGNAAQRIMILRGTAGGGKSTLVEILEKIVGRENVTELRTEHVSDRFELYRYIGKTLLTGKDVPGAFLMNKGAHTLKKLVGHDYISAEGKNSNVTFELRGDFDVAITANSPLRVKLEGDADAWRRRLMIIDYTKPPPKQKISNFAASLFEEEAPGILRWALEGALAHEEELLHHGNFVLTSRQLDRVEQLLAESDSVREFVRTCVRPSRHDTLTVEDIVQNYAIFCDNRNFHPLPPNAVHKQLPDLMMEFHGVALHHDLKSPEGTAVRGYKGVALENI